MSRGEIIAAVLLSVASYLQRYLEGEDLPIGRENMPECSVCGEGFQESQLLRCYDCGKAYCPKCAEKDLTIMALGVCPDCEEVFEDEEDEWGVGVRKGGWSTTMMKRRTFSTDEEGRIIMPFPKVVLPHHGIEAEALEWI